MTNFLFGTQKAPSRTVKPAATNLRIQTSANGVARSFGYGQARISGNLLWYGGFEAVPTFQTVSSGGGKGGGGGGGSTTEQTGWNYFASAIWGLCEGPITGVLLGWENKSPVSLGQGTPLKTSPSTTDAGNETFTLFDGDYQQLPWSWLASYDPSGAQNFRGIAYEAAYNLNLGGSTELPNMTFEVRFAITGAITESFTIPSGQAVQAQYFDYDYGAIGHTVIPVTAPYQLSGASDVPYQQSVLAGALGTEAQWIASAAFGVVWDAGVSGSRTPGKALTLVSGAPSAGEFQVVPIGQSCYINFSATDAGQPIVLIAAAMSPGVYYTSETTGTLSTGSAVVTNLGSMSGIVAGSRVGGTGIPPFTFVQSLSGGIATGSTSSGSAVVSNVTGTFSAPAGTPVSDSAGAFPAGTTASSVTPAGITLSSSSGLTIAGATIIIAGVIDDPAVVLNYNQIIYLSAADAAQLAPGTPVFSTGMNLSFVVESVVPAGSTYTANLNYSSGVSINDVFTYTTTITGDLSAGSSVITSPSTVAGVTTSATNVTTPYGALPSDFNSGVPVTIAGITQGSITLSHTAGSSVGSDVLTFANEVTLSQPATAGGSGVSLTFIGDQLSQTLSVPTGGTYNITVNSAAGYGTFTFAAADVGRTILIVDVADANPADVLQDFLTNPYYGLTQFPADRIGDLSTYRAYCQAAGLVVSPVIATQAAANSFLQDLMSATNSEIVWSGGLLTVVPYGDTAIAANGATFTPPSAPLYGLDDDDFLQNEGTNPNSTSTASSPDPVTITRKDIADQENDIKIEYLDRGNQYNPTIIEAQDNAAIELFGLKSNGSKQLHLLCDLQAALTSAQLMLGRQQVLRTFSFTLGREYILLDPMDIVAITDANAGLNDQWVRIKEITENDDRTLSIAAEEYLEGTGAAPLCPHQRPAGYVPNYNVAAPDALQPMFFDAPAQIGNVLGMETILCTNGSGANWGGCDIWISQDNVTFKYAGTLLGGTCMGVLTANLPIGSDPDTSDTLSVNLTESEGSLVSGTQADADQGYTLSLVDNELVTYEQATLTGQYKYNLGKNGSTPGYLRRGFFGTAIASHTTGAKFARLREGSYFSIGYDNADIGQTIYVKLLSFNPYGGGKMTLDAATSYSHTLSAPPVASSGLLAQVIATPDIQLNAATGQTTVTSQAGGAIASGSLTAILSAAYTSIGQTLQISGSIGLNETGGVVTCLVSIFRDGSAVYSPAPVLVPATVSSANTTITVPFNFTDTPAAGAHTYTIKAEANGADMNWTSAELVVTEIKR